MTERELELDAMLRVSEEHCRYWEARALYAELPRWRRAWQALKSWLGDRGLEEVEA